MYNDFPFISENEILKISKAYNEKLEKVKSLKFDEDFTKRLKHLDMCLKNAIHYIDNLYGLMKNIDIKNLLSSIKEQIFINLEKLKTLYEISDTEKFEVSIQDEGNFNNNLKNIINQLLEFLEEMFYFMEYEENNKIKSALKNIFITTLNNIKDINSLISKTSNIKIFSLFKKY